MKNPNGFGTVYKMSGKRRKKWRVQITVSWENGKQKRVTIGYFEKQDDAKNFLTNYKYNPNAKLTLGEVYKQWTSRHFEKVSESRQYNINSRYKNHIIKLENECISEINLNKLQNFMDSLTCSSGTASEIKAILNLIFEYALKNDFISKNPVKFIEMGKYKKVFDKKEFSKEEIDILWNNLDVPNVDTVLILIYTGMRVGEMLNLKLKNIDLEKRDIFISESKTNSGIRHIPIHDKILPLIINRMHNQEHLIVLENNIPVSYYAYKYQFQNVMKALNLKHNPHECRHTTATLLSNAGANTVSIAKIMGHTNYYTTTIYTHKDNEELKKAMFSIS